MSNDPTEPERERHILDLDPESRPHQQRWAVRPEGEPPPPDNWAELTLDLGDPAAGIPTPEDFVDEHPAPRRAEVVVGGMDELMEMLRASDKMRARLMRRDLRWINGIISAAGLEIVLVRPAQEDD